MAAYNHGAERRDCLRKVEKVKDEFIQKMIRLDSAAWDRVDEEIQTGFEGCEAAWMARENDEVLNHWPPLYILGTEQQTEEGNQVLSIYEDDDVCVKLIEIKTEYMYSNPTSNFNLSLPNLGYRTNYV